MYTMRLYTYTIRVLYTDGSTEVRKYFRTSILPEISIFESTFVFYLRIEYLRWYESTFVLSYFRTVKPLYTYVRCTHTPEVNLSYEGTILYLYLKVHCTRTCTFKLLSYQGTKVLSYESIIVYFRSVTIYLFRTRACTCVQYSISLSVISVISDNKL